MAVKIRQDGAWVDVGQSSSLSGVTQFALLKDQKNFDINGGSFTNNAWRDRDLTVEEDPQGFVNFTAGGSTSSGSAGNTPGYWSLAAGTYRIDWSAPGYEVNRHKTRLVYSTTESQISTAGLDVGSSFAEGSTANASNIDLTDELVQTDSTGSKIITITETTYFKIMHWCTNSRSDWGFGDGMYPGGSYDTGPNIYTQVRIENLATSVKNNATYVDGTTRIAKLYDAKTSGSAGGTYTSTDGWVDRVLNSKTDPQSLVSWPGGASTGTDGTNTYFSLPEGTYKIYWSTPVFNLDSAQSRLVYANNSSFTSPSYVVGGNAWDSSSLGSNTQSPTTGTSIVTITEVTYFKVQVMGGTTETTDGLGKPTSWGEEIYTQVEVQDLATAVKDNATYVQGHDKVAYLYDQKDSGTDGGSFTQDAWRGRDLTTKSDPFSLISSFIPTTNGTTTPSPGNDPGVWALAAGKYKIHWKACGLAVNRHKSRLTYATDSGFTTGVGYVYGSSSYAQLEEDTESFGVAILEPSATWYYKIEHYCKTTNSGGDGFGQASDITSVDEIYTQVVVEDLATAVKATSAADAGMSYTTKTGTYTLVATDDQKLIATDGQINLDQNIFSPADAITIYNNSSSSITISQGTGVTLRLVGTASTGDRTLAQRGIVTIVCVATNEFVISGGGLT